MMDIYWLKVLRFVLELVTLVLGWLVMDWLYKRAFPSKDGDGE